MNPIVINILAVVAGIIIGSAMNMGIIKISGSIIPPPGGADVALAVVVYRCDLVGAYIPMAYIAAKLTVKPT